MGQAAAIIDPVNQRRRALFMKAVMDAVADVAAPFEPEKREALAVAYARIFDAKQLSDILRFYGSESGTDYAHRGAMVLDDPDYQAVVEKSMLTVLMMLVAVPTAALRAKCGPSRY